MRSRPGASPAGGAGAHDEPVRREEGLEPIVDLRADGQVVIEIDTRPRRVVAVIATGAGPTKAQVVDAWARHELLIIDGGEDPAEALGVAVRLGADAVIVDTGLAREIQAARARARLGSERGARLTEREWRVLELLAGGSTTGQIADALFVAQVTVRTHIAALVRKLGVADRAEAARLLQEAPLPP